MSAAVLIPLLLEILKDAPDLVRAVRNLIDAIEGKAPADGTPMAPEVIAAMSGDFETLKLLLAKK